MIQGGGQKASGGFTIVETLIVLAVTGLLFASAILLIQGKQGQTEFTTAINDMQQQLQQIINETSSGYYPNGSDFTCDGASHPVNITAGASKQGTNSGCIFLGKAIQFGTTNPQQLGILPLIGNQYQSSTLTPVLNLAQARPRALYPANVSETGVPTTAAATVGTENGLVVATASSSCPGVSGGICYVPTGGGAPVQTGLAAFVAGDSNGNISALANTGGLQSGQQQLSLYSVGSPSSANQDLTTVSQEIGNNPFNVPQQLAAAQAVYICMASGTTNQAALFTIDSNLHISLAVKYGGTTC